MQTEKDLSVKPEPDSYEKPVCRVNIFTAEDSLMSAGGGASSDWRQFDGGRDSEGDGWM